MILTFKVLECKKFARLRPMITLLVIGGSIMLYNIVYITAKVDDPRINRSGVSRSFIENISIINMVIYYYNL